MKTKSIWQHLVLSATCLPIPAQYSHSKANLTAIKEWYLGLLQVQGNLCLASLATQIQDNVSESYLVCLCPAGFLSNLGHAGKAARTAIYYKYTKIQLRIFTAHWNNDKLWVLFSIKCLNDKQGFNIFFCNMCANSCLHSYSSWWLNWYPPIFLLRWQMSNSSWGKKI